MAAAEVHVSLPAFSRLCLLCNSGGAASQLVGGLDAVLSDPAALEELRCRLTGLERELPLVSGVCPACRRRLLRCQRHLVRFRAAADALSVAYRRAAAARRASHVLLRRGRQRSEVTYSTCCQLAAGRPTHLAALVRHLVTETFGAEALECRVVISSSVPPPAEGATGRQQGAADRDAGETDEGSAGSEDTDRECAGGGDRGTVRECARAGGGDRGTDRECAAGVDRDRPAGSDVRGEVWQADGIAESRGTLTDSGCVPAVKDTARSSPDCGSSDLVCSSVSEVPARGRSIEDAVAPENSLKEEEEDTEDDEEEEKSREDWSDLDWPTGRLPRRTRRRTAAPSVPDQQSLADHRTDAQSQSQSQTQPVAGRRGRPRRDTPGGRYCHMCRQSFRSERSLKAHVEKLHKVAGSTEPEEPARVWCPACSALLPPSDVTDHVTQQHGGRLECGCCRLALEGATAAARHCADQHTANYMCIVCLQMYSGQDQLISHMNSSHNPSLAVPGSAERPDTADPVAAVYADLVRRLRGRARRLQLSVLGRTAVRCPYCAQTCSLHYLRTHLYKHRSAGFRCHACEKCFKFPVSFQKHLLLHAGRADKCPQCDAVFSSRSNLLSHLRTHSAERQFSCDRCQKRFKFKQTRDAHVRRAHGGGAAKVCDVCGAEFRLQYQLTVHLARHTNSRTIRCPLCPRLYELNLDLKRHLYSKHKIRVAEAERRFPEIRRRPNTTLEPAEEPDRAGPDAPDLPDLPDLPADPDAPDGPCEGQQQRPTLPPAGSVYHTASSASAAAAAAAAVYLSADHPPAADGFLAGAGAADEGAAQLEVSRIIAVPPELLAAEPLDGTGASAGAGQMLLLVGGADVGMLMRDVLPTSSAAAF